MRPAPGIRKALNLNDSGLFIVTHRRLELRTP
jgi:hypothetical protein